MRKNFLKPLFVAAFGMMACLSANAQVVSNATPDLGAGDSFWGSYFTFEVVAKDAASDATNVTYDVNITGLSGADAGEYEGDIQSEITIPSTVQVTKDGVKYTLNVKSITSLQGYDALTTLTFDPDFAGTAAAGAFANLPALTQVVANMATAVELNAEAFDPTIAYSATVKLIVPEAVASVQSYAKTKGWRRFINISNGTYTLGDVNNDGVIKNADISLMQATINKKRDQNDPLERYDVNGNGAFQNTDLSTLRGKINRKYK